MPSASAKKCASSDSVFYAWDFWVVVLFIIMNRNACAVRSAQLFVVVFKLCEQSAHTS